MDNWRQASWKQAEKINGKFHPLAYLRIHTVMGDQIVLSLYKKGKERQIHTSPSWEEMYRYLVGYYYGIVDTLNLVKEAVK